MTRVGVIARADLTGLGNQSRNWVRFLDPHKVIVIDSTSFNGNEQHFEWYEGRKNVQIIDGFIKDEQIDSILEDIDLLLTFEIPYNYQLIARAKQLGVKTIIQNNWEFTDYLQRPNLPLPDLLLNHSYWHIDEQKKLWPEISDYCPTPIFVEDYDEIFEQNYKRKGVMRFLHIAGRKTHEDRNGTNDLIAAVKMIPAKYNFELVIKAQTADIPYINDPRVTIDRDSPVDEKELYRDFDAVIMPRRYGGACLPMTEALASGLPVIMTDIDPNSELLPNEWLVKSEKKGSFMARTNIDIYSADHQSLAETIIHFSEFIDKDTAREIADNEYSSGEVELRWHLLLQKLRL